MVIVFFLLGALQTVGAFMVMASAKSAIHEIYGAVLWLGALQCFGVAAICSVLARRSAPDEPRVTR